jgi:pimeloyl-ACP methyl ester carboxylesterase
MARFVLVHGAFGGAWSWEPVIGELEAAGHDVTALDLPGAGDDDTPIEGVTLDAYAERIGAALAADPEPAILVGHSMGGIAITEAAGRFSDQIALLIYVAAFLPRDGQSLVALASTPEGANDQIQANIVVEGDPPVATLPDHAARTAVYGRATEEQFAWATERRRAQAVQPFVTPVSIDDDVVGAIPRAYVHCLQDNSIPLALQRRMVRENACVQVLEIDTDHAPQLSATAELVDALDKLATVRA